MMIINKIKKIIIGLFLILIPSLSFAGADFIPSDTDDLPEGSTNQYYTSARTLSSTGVTSMTENYIPKKGNTGIFVDGTMYDNGNIGIGTTSPSTKLDVNGVITATGGNSTTWNSALQSEVDGSITNEIQNIFQTVSSQSGSTTADSSTDTLTINGGGIATSAISGDTLTITATEVDGSTTNEINTITLPDANVTSGLGLTFAQSGSIAITESASDTVTFTVTETDPVAKAINGVLKSNGTTLSACSNLADVVYLTTEADTLQSVADRGDTVIDGVNLATSSGNVGIGTTAPGFKLDVAGTASVNSLNVNGAYTLPTADGTNTYVLKTNGAGTVSWAADIDTTYTAGSDLDLSGTEFAVESQLDGVSTITRASSDLTLSTTSSGNIVMNPAGNVGIGTTAPAFKLDVAGTSSVDSLNINGAYMLPTADGTADYVLQTNGSGVVSWAEMSGGASVWTESGDDIYNANSGNVGVGTTSPTVGRFSINNKIIVVDVLTDNAISAAITALNGSTGIIQLVTGTYVVDGTITVPASVTIQGSGWGTILDCSTMATGNNGITIAGSNVVLKDFAIKGTKGGGKTVDLIGDATGTSYYNARLDHLYVYNSDSYGVKFDLWCGDLVMSRCYIYDCDGSGAYLDGTRWWVRDCHIENNDSHGLEIVSTARYQGHIEGCTINSNAGTQIYGMNVWGSIKNNSIYAGSSNNGIQLPGAGDSAVAVVGNDIYSSSGIGVYCPTNGASATITGNHFSSSTGSGYGVYLQAAHVCTISGNTFGDYPNVTMLYGVYITGAATSNIIASNNFIMTTNAVYTTGSSENYVSGNAMGNSRIIMTSTGKIVNLDKRTDDGTSDARITMRQERLSTGTVAANFGITNDVFLEDAAGNSQEATRIEYAWTDATNGSEDSRMSLYTTAGGAAVAETLRLESGNVGIGTTAASSYRLEVNGALIADNYYSSDGTVGVTCTVCAGFKDGLCVSSGD